MELEEFFGLIREQSELERRGQVNDTYNTTWIHGDFLTRFPSLTIPYLVVLSLATLSGTIGNIMVIGAVLVSARLRTTGNMFIVNLSIADLVVTTMVFPFSFIGVVGGPRFFMNRVLLCHVVAGLCLPSCVCSLWNMGAIAFNRYIFLCQNHVYRRLYTRWSTLAMCVGLWIGSFVALELPILLGWGAHSFDMKTMMCSYSRLADYGFTLFFCLFAISTPMLLVSFFYLKIYLYVRASKKRLKKFSLGEKEDKGKNSKQVSNMERLFVARKKEEIQLARTLFLVFFAYFFCWVPYAIVVLADPEDQLPMVVHVVVVQLGHGNSSLNSIIYASTNHQFRKGYRMFLQVLFRPIKRLYNSMTAIPPSVRKNNSTEDTNVSKVFFVSSSNM